MDKELTLEEIRKAQLEIALEMSDVNRTKAEQVLLEQASLHLRNLERSMVASFEKSLLSSLKKESVALHTLTLEMEATSHKLEKLSGILKKIVKITGQIIDILNLVK